MAGLSELIDESATKDPNSLFAAHIAGDTQISAVLYAADYTILASNPLSDALTDYPSGALYPRNSFVRLFSGEASVRDRYRDELDVLQSQAAAAIRLARAAKNPLVENLVAKLKSLPAYQRLRNGFEVTDYVQSTSTYLRDGSPVTAVKTEWVRIAENRLLILNRFSEDDAERFAFSRGSAPNEGSLFRSAR
ncbi:MAG: hypothetical protein M3N13_04760 [Candidatus Eremiobacteraeota bacterium]|nr:hypothetical protein [Candidatus Eremiobacteraeota bacterium]